MYTHFDLWDPLDSKFLSDIALIQKNYKQAFDQNILITKIEDCI